MDEVTFVIEDDEDDDLETSYYIGVFSFQYSTFNILVNVER